MEVEVQVAGHGGCGEGGCGEGGGERTPAGARKEGGEQGCHEGEQEGLGAGARRRPHRRSGGVRGGARDVTPCRCVFPVAHRVNLSISLVGAKGIRPFTVS